MQKSIKDLMYMLLVRTHTQAPLPLLPPPSQANEVHLRAASRFFLGTSCRRMFKAWTLYAATAKLVRESALSSTSARGQRWATMRALRCWRLWLAEVAKPKLRQQEWARTQHNLVLKRKSMCALWMVCALSLC